MITPADLDRLLAEVQNVDLVEGWFERNGLDPEAQGWIMEIGNQGLEVLLRHAMELAVMEASQNLGEDEQFGMVALGGRDLMEPVAKTLAICFFQIGWEAHKQYRTSE